MNNKTERRRIRKKQKIHLNWITRSTDLRLS